MLSCTYEVVAIDGDYAHLRRNDIEPEDNETKLVARALLPPEIFPPRCFLSRTFMASRKPGGRLLFRAGGCGRVRLRKTRPFITWVTACPNWGLCCPAAFSWRIRISGATAVS